MRIIWSHNVYDVLQAGAVKTSLTKHLHIDSDDEEIEDLEDNKAAVNGKPGKVDVKLGIFLYSPDSMLC